ncbi:hypothetical protein AB0C07_21465 [Actinoplanes missouriensis]|uniref:hypothetical protein n=1 Tax=Actinoplanes missouriensis TaxID=1866 RepID=UPI0033DFA811
MAMLISIHAVSVVEKEGEGGVAGVAAPGGVGAAVLGGVVAGVPGGFSGCSAQAARVAVRVTAINARRLIGTRAVSSSGTVDVNAFY